MPPRASLTPSEIAARKQSSKTKAKASQESGGENKGDTDRPLQWPSKIKALERKVWNETTGQQSEYGESDHDNASEKSDNDNEMEVPEDDDFESLSQEELVKEIPHFVRTPGTSKAASPHLQTSCNVSEVDVQVADKASDGHGGRSKPYYREASSTAVTKHQPEKKKDTKKRSKLEE
ncbi:hypothetical protein EDD22DRAFT_951784 [Suillus occidentalis]|nr:hypothetical protein EDD22DRAFT_951784 [Suillus occidentalis]